MLVNRYVIGLGRAEAIHENEKACQRAVPSAAVHRSVWGPCYRTPATMQVSPAILLLH